MMTNSHATNVTLPSISTARPSTATIVTRNAMGERELFDQPGTFASRTTAFNARSIKPPERFPQLHQSLLIGQSQQAARAAQAAQASSSSLPAVNREDVDIENAHLFLDMNVAVADDNGEPYLLVRAKSSVFGGTIATYADLLLEDAPNGTTGAKQIAPVGSVFKTLDGKDTTVISTVRLSTLRTQFPDLTTIYASSFVEIEDQQGNIKTTLKFTEYPFSWDEIDALYPAHSGQPSAPVAARHAQARASDTQPTQRSRVSLQSGGPVYTATAPVDLNIDGLIKVCLNRNHADCDYAADQYMDPNEITDVNIPFAGQIEIPHQITQIYATDTAIEDMPSGIDEITNIYLQEGNYGGATKQSYKGLAGQTLHFSDYLNIVEDIANKKTVISWNIPREEGRFGNAKLFSNIAEANWNITLRSVANLIFGVVLPTFRSR